MIIKDRRYTRDFKARGEVYPLCHLRPFRVNIMVRKNRTVPMWFEFSTHVFTEEYDKTVSPDYTIYDKMDIQGTYHHTRIFDMERYELSQKLPQILQGVQGKTRVYTIPKNKGKGGFMIQTKMYNRHYHIFFNIFRRKDTAIFYVKSAYCSLHPHRGHTRNIADFLMDKGFT